PAALAARLDPAEQQLASDPAPAERAVDREPPEIRGLPGAAARHDEHDADDRVSRGGGHEDVTPRIEDDGRGRGLARVPVTDGRVELLLEDARHERREARELLPAAGAIRHVADEARAHMRSGTGTPSPWRTSARWSETTWSAARRARRVASSFSCAIGCVW